LGGVSTGKPQLSNLLQGGKARELEKIKKEKINAGRGGNFVYPPPKTKGREMRKKNRVILKTLCTLIAQIQKGALEATFLRKKKLPKGKNIRVLLNPIEGETAFLFQREGGGANSPAFLGDSVEKEEQA